MTTARPTLDCSSHCAAGEPCRIAADCQCIGWWSDAAWEASVQVGAALGEQHDALQRYLAHPDGSPERRACWDEWKAAVRKKRAAQARLDAETAHRPCQQTAEGKAGEGE